MVRVNLDTYKQKHPLAGWLIYLVGDKGLEPLTLSL